MLEKERERERERERESSYVYYKFSIPKYTFRRKLSSIEAKVGDVVELARNEFGMIWRA